MSDMFDDKPTALATVQPTTNPLAIYSQLVSQGVAPSELRELLSLTHEYEQNEAAKAFAGALTDFQSRCPRVGKEREAKITSDRGNYSYKYANYEDIMAAIGPLLSECRLVVSVSTEAIDKGIRVTVKIRHGTHVEPHTMDVPVPQMKVNDTQKYGAALSYAKRYALCAALNVVVADEDTDAASCFEPISESQGRQIEAFISDHNIDKGPFLNWLGVAAIADIPAERFDTAMAGLRSKAKGSK